MNSNILRKLLATVLVAYALPVVAQDGAAAGSEKNRVGVPIDWSSRRVLHSMTLDKEFEGAASHEPRILFQYFQRNNARLATQAGRMRGSLPRKTAIQRDWNFTLGSGTIAPNM